MVVGVRVGVDSASKGEVGGNLPGKFLVGQGCRFRCPQGLGRPDDRTDRVLDNRKW